MNTQFVESFANKALFVAKSRLYDEGTTLAWTLDYPPDFLLQIT